MTILQDLICTRNTEMQRPEIQGKLWADLQLPLYKRLDIVLNHSPIRVVQPESFGSLNITVVVKVDQRFLARLGYAGIMLESTLVDPVSWYQRIWARLKIGSVGRSVVCSSWRVCVDTTRDALWS